MNSPVTIWTLQCSEGFHKAPENGDGIPVVQRLEDDHLPNSDNGGAQRDVATPSSPDDQATGTTRFTINIPKSVLEPSHQIT